MAVHELSRRLRVQHLRARRGRPAPDEKWPIRVTPTDPPRAVAHCLACADMGAGYDARWCPADMRSQPLSVANGNGSASLLAPRAPHREPVAQGARLDRPVRASGQTPSSSRCIASASALTPLSGRT